MLSLTNILLIILIVLVFYGIISINNLLGKIFNKHTEDIRYISDKLQSINSELESIGALLRHTFGEYEITGSLEKDMAQLIIYFRRLISMVERK